MSEASAYQPFDENTFERPPHLTKAQARHARRAEAKASKQQKVAKPLVAKNENQQDYIDILREGESVIALGPAGTGKTYLPARIAAQRMLSGQIEKIIVTRVTVSAQRHAIGFLPGNIDAKMKPWLTPVIEGICAEVSKNTLENWRANGQFEIVPFEYMRGRTFDNACVILDEAQNACFADLKLFVTRTGVDTQVIIAGDPGQIDIPNSGLEDITTIAEEEEIVDTIEFTEDDVVRSEQAKKWVKGIAAFERRRAALAHGRNLDSPPAFLQSAGR